MKKFDYVIAICIAFAIFTLGFNMGHDLFVPDVEEVSDEIAVSPFDTSYPETWDGGCEDGTIRMLAGWKYTNGVVEDESGQLWKFDGEIADEDLLLIWIADLHTPNDITDDVVLKVWKECY